MKTVKNLALSLGASVAPFLTTASVVRAADIVTIDAPGFFFDNPSALFSNILTFVVALAVLLAFFYLVWGGIDWITSGGDKSKTEGARNKITAAVVGLIVLAASYALLQLVLTLINATGETGINFG